MKVLNGHFSLLLKWIGLFLNFINSYLIGISSLLRKQVLIWTIWIKVVKEWIVLIKHGRALLHVWILTTRDHCAWFWLVFIRQRRGCWKVVVFTKQLIDVILLDLAWLWYLLLVLALNHTILNALLLLEDIIIFICGFLIDKHAFGHGCGVISESLSLLNETRLISFVDKNFNQVFWVKRFLM